VADRSWAREQLRTSFEEVPDLYDRARPKYPPEIFDELADLARLPETARIVEIGCGTGQATIPLSERGYRVTCVELGEQLTAFARRRLSVFPTTEIINAAFETWEPRDADYDAVVAFTAFHWLDPELRYAKSASLLRAGGSLAVVATQHTLAEDGDQFFADVQEDYVALTDENDKSPPPHPDQVDDLTAEIEGSGYFRSVSVRRHLWDTIYTADEYIALLDTYSGHRALADETRRRLYERIRERIEGRPDQRVRKTYLATLNVATRV
jgi:SAM-dependent methyltransferase